MEMIAQFVQKTKTRFNGNWNEKRVNSFFIDFKHIFEATATDTTKKYLVRASYLEIYNENVRDLLAKEYKASLDLKVNIFIHWIALLNQNRL